MNAYPLMYRITEPVQGKGFAALVIAEGKVLMARENDEWWCHGVEPGTLTAEGEGPTVAYQRFRKEFANLLEDLAEEAPSFDRFQQEVRMFFATDRVDEARWRIAVAEMRPPEGLDSAFAGMQRMAPRESSIKIELQAKFVATPVAEAVESLRLIEFKTAA